MSWRSCCGAAKAGWHDHPERRFITQRYLRHQRRLTREAIARLSEGEGDGDADPGAVPWQDTREDSIELPIRLHDLRLEAVTRVLREHGAARVLDLGCGEGRLRATTQRRPSR